MTGTVHHGDGNGTGEGTRGMSLRRWRIARTGFEGKPAHGGTPTRCFWTLKARARLSRGLHLDSRIIRVRDADPRVRDRGVTQGFQIESQGLPP